MLEVALQIIICLLLAAFLGTFIGYMLGKCRGELVARRDYFGLELSHHHSKEKKNQSSEKPTVSRRPQRDHLVVEDEDNTEIDSAPQGEQPVFLTAPRNGAGDKLTRIRGIGVKIDEALKEIGIYHFDQIAGWNDKNIEWIENNIAFPGRVSREQWVAQAKILASGKSTRFAKRVDNGEVASSIKK